MPSTPNLQGVSSDVLTIARNQIKARRSSADFGEIVSNGAYTRPWHVNMLNSALLDVYNGISPRLIITMPPRHSKSESTSKYLPAWWLGKRPDDRVMLASYEAELAASWGRKARDILEEHGPTLFDVQVDPTSKAANRWDINDRDGGMVTVGVGGALTGRGANLLIIDDYLRNSEDARSKIIRDKTWDWWTGTARTRLEPNGRIIIMATRWHEDDLIGHLLENDDGVD